MPLTFTVNGKKLSFLPTGDVAVIDTTGQSTVQGSWRTAAAGTEPQDNHVHYTLSGANQTPLQALYGIDGNNQLQIVLQDATGAKSASAVFLGGIEIDDGHHLIYNLISGTGAALNKTITIYGSNFRIEESTCNLLMDLANGGQISIAGDGGINSLSAEQNHLMGFNADDLLRFEATTTNTLDSGALSAVPAKLAFLGTWDIQNGKLVFLSKITGDITKPDVQIGFAGKIGAITAGFVYFADSTGTQLAFNISGQHVWKAGDTTTTFNWKSTLGFSNKSFNASTSFDLTSKTTSGRSFSLDGSLTLQQPVGGPLTMDFTLKGTYSWPNHLLSFEADVSDVAGAVSYNLMLEGTFKLGNSTITFDVKFSNAATGNTFSLDLNVGGDRTALMQALAFHLNISQTAAGTMINATVAVTFQLKFVAGVGTIQ